MSEATSFKPGDTAIAKFARYPAQVTVEERLADGSWRVRTRTGAIKIVRRLESADGQHVETADDAETQEAPAEATEAQVRPPAATTPAPVAFAHTQPQSLSLLSAAAAVLERSGEAMSVKAMIEQATASGLWTPKGGKTPEQTLYSAIIREIKDKGDASRFRRGETKGSFAFALSD